MTPDSPLSLESISEDELISLYEHTSDLAGILPNERYENYEFLAEGAVKKVYKVTDTHCDRDVAFARIKPELIDWQQSVEFIQEVQLTSSFEHPHIIRVYDLGVSEDDTPWFTMELTSGLTLDDWIKQHELSLNQKLNIISNICDAMTYAHARNVLHLDLKPENISIGIHGQVLIVDWGLAIWSLNQAAENNTDIAHIKGTPGYMAPEQARGDYYPAAQTDIFSIGALFYFILTGESPVVGDSSQVRLISTINSRLKDLTHPSIPSRLSPIIKKCLATYPSHRYASANELSADIERFQSGCATEAGPDSLSNISSLFFQRHKTAVIISAALLAIAIISATTYVRQVQKSKSIADHERQIALSLVEELRVKDEEKILRNEQHAIDLYKKSKSDFHNGFINNAYLAAELAHELSPIDPKIRELFGLVSFASQDFIGATDLLIHDESKPRIALLLELSEKHNALSDQDSINEIPNTFDTLCSQFRTPTASHFFLYSAKHGNRRTHAKLVENLLAHDNNLSEIHFSWDPKTRTLDLTGNPKLKTLLVEDTAFAPAYNIIDGLPVELLILDDTPHNRRHGSRFLPDRFCKLKLSNKSSL